MKKFAYKLFIISSIAISSLWGQEWEVISEMPIPVKGAQAIVQNSMVYIIGGYSDSTFSPINKIQVFDPQDTSWIVIEDTLAIGRDGHVVVKYENKAWILGGAAAEDSLDESLETWDFITSPVIYTFNAIFNRKYATAQIYNDVIYIFGGFNIELVEDSTSLNYMVVYDINSKTFSYSNAQDFTTENAPIHQMSVLLENNIFLFGGVSWGLSRSIYVYDVIGDTFTELSTFLLDARAGGSAVKIDDSTIALIGGYNEASQPMASVEVLSIEDSYIYYQENFKNLNYARSEPTAVKIDSFVYVFGGEDNDNNCIPFVEKAYIRGKPTNIKSSDRFNLIKDFKLFQNYPNPFNPATTIILNNQKPMHIKLDIYSINGSHIKSLIKNDYLSAGSHQIIWDGTDKHNNPVSSGIYFYKCDNGIISETKRMILMR